ncbi:MAG: hypothetical protein M3Z75_23045 [Actinomycetota bacterium]|nr:hypothetical protein [Actinomycetota bacterium]
MPRNELTGLYLKEAAQRAIAPGALPEAAGREIDLAATSFRGRCLTRPVFLDHAEHSQLTADLENFYTALTALPSRLFDGDLGAFAAAVGLTGEQVAAAAMAPGTPPTRMVRADLYHESAGFALMEINMGSTVGGGDNAMVNRAMLTHPDLAEFVRVHSLSYTDTLAEIANTIMAECGLAAHDGSLVAAVDWPPAADRFNAVLQTSANELAALGIDFVPCHLRDLSRRDRRVWLGDRPVDVIYRIFMIEDLLHPEGPALINPVLQAAERGEVKIFTPMHSQLYSCKGALALLSDEANQQLCTTAERASLNRLLPWTRMLRPGPVTAGGGRVDLLDYAAGHREELILKPTAMHGGLGIVAGWLTGPREWQSELRARMGEPFVLQRRVRPVPELFPGDRGLEPWVLTWGAYLCGRGYGGMWVRGSADRETGGVNMATGAYATCCFHEPAPAVAGS